jgi:hypothetical protein
MGGQRVSTQGCAEQPRTLAKSPIPTFGKNPHSFGLMNGLFIHLHPEIHANPPFSKFGTAPAEHWS